MPQILIILEEDVLHNEFYLGKSGDFATIDYFLRKNYQVFLCSANDLQNSVQNLKVFLLKNKNYEENYCMAILNECKNIKQKISPMSNVAGKMCVKLEFENANFDEIKNGALFFSRAMPQSLTQNFLKNFNILKQRFKTIQNMEEIVLYKDKVIPFLLQNNKEYIDDFCKIYNQKIAKINEKSYQDLAIDSIIVNIDEDFEMNFGKIKSFAQFPICIKPFNLFGGIGVGIFQNIDKATIETHLQKIKTKFAEFNITEKHLVLIQKAVKHPEFGDIRAIFSYGKFLGAFKRYEPKNWIHNTINGAIIVPVCNENFEFFPSFEEKFHSNFKKTIEIIYNLNKKIHFLQKEVFYGCDLLLGENQSLPQFKLTEINIACPTGFAFLESSFICNKNFELTWENIEKYYFENKRIIDVCFDDMAKNSLAI